MNKRSLCKHCLFPQTVCICDSVESVTTTISIDVLQHPSELRSSKNTLRLAKLCCPEINICLGESENDFIDVKQKIEQSKEQVYVLYPNEKAISISDAQQKIAKDSRIRMIIIDGTWKKAYKIWSLNPWLHSLPSIKLDEFANCYDIRKSPSNTHLSTIECIAHAIKSFDHTTNIEPFFNVLKKRQETFLKHGHSRAKNKIS